MDQSYGDGDWCKHRNVIYLRGVLYLETKNRRYYTINMECLEINNEGLHTEDIYSIVSTNTVGVLIFSTQIKYSC